jgi:predicted DNA-binding transcriptional regulator AlpA
MPTLPDIATLNPNDFISTADLGAYSGIATSTIETWRCRSPGKLPKHHKIGGHLVRYRVADAREWLGLNVSNSAT